MTDLMIVSFQKDFPFLHHALRSISKFAAGFGFLRLLVPNEDVREAHHLLSQQKLSFPYSIIGYEEWPQMGFMHHMRQIMHADLFTDAQVIGHLDSDAIFTVPVTPETYVRDGKPIIRFEPFSRIGQRHPNICQWQVAAEACLPFRVESEFMRALPLFYCREVYPKARELIERKTGKPIDEYMKLQRNEFPQSFAEHPTLGAVAFECFRDKHLFVEQFGDRPDPDNCVQQFWSRSGLNEGVDLWVKGRQQRVVPMQMIEEILGKDGA